MDGIVAWLKLSLAQMLVYGADLLLSTYTSLDIPLYLVPIIGAALSALATWLRNQFGIEASRKTAKATRPGEPSLFARVFGV